ncbi:putative oxidoreductase GLYR1 like protein [Argiope bruennichi]|uniref:Cytokine-like nuclear factor N-PAC n=1 Tax=Argiope bruennichi TaxID=94029 RepID=A0A8T0E187_ARGBR|nr:putative oxidoreductase GLYR1 like protein [Argiope bruennichi]
MVTKNFEVGDLVWAKMKNFPPWPGQIAEPPATAKPRKGSHYVYFLGSKNYAWMKDETINHHALRLIPPESKKKTALLQTAIDEIIELSKDRPFKVDEIIDDDASLEVSPKKKSPKKGKLEDSKSSPESKISRKRPSFDKLSKSPKVRVIDGENSKDHSLRDMGSFPRIGPSSMSDDDDTSSTSRPTATGVNSRVKNASDSSPDDDESLDSYKKFVPPTSKKIGFLGLGTMGHNIAKHLITSGHYVTVWNRTPGKCLDLIKAGAISSETPAEVVKASDITFCCVSDALAVRSLLFGPTGVLTGLTDSNDAESGESSEKGYVEMTSMDFETSREISEAVELRGGRYLEASLIGSKNYAMEGNLLILASGNAELFQECNTCFHAMSETVYFVSTEVGQSLKYSLALKSLMGTTFAAMAECLVLSERTKISQVDFLRLLTLKGFSCPEVLDKAKSIIEHKFSTPPCTALRHQQNDLALIHTMSNQFSQPMPVTSAANELYIHAKLLGYGDHDVAAVYYGAKY